jgi:hypothetical protein
MKFRFSFLVALAAAAVAGCAAYYSVFGLSQLFAGASMAVIIMASSLEFSKIVAVTFLHRYWSRVSKTLKIYLTTGIIILVIVTSAGIYGFLSNAYQKTAYKFEASEGQINVLTGKKILFEKNITDNQTIITTKTKRAEQLGGLRTNQEARLDANNNSNKNAVRGDINAATKEIQKLNIDIDALNIKNSILLDSANVYAAKIIESKTGSNATSEIGPLKYIAQLTGYPMDKVVNWFILILIFVFDPLAVALVIATNRVLELEKEDRNKKPVVPVEPILDLPIVDILPEPPMENAMMRSDVIAQPEEEYSSDEPEIEPEPEIDELINEGVNEGVNEETSDEINVPVPMHKGIELKDIKEIKEKTNRGFSMDIPEPNNSFQRIGTNKVIKDDDDKKVIFKRNK